MPAGTTGIFRNRFRALSVSAFLPRGTIFFAHLPDFSRTRDEWRQSDIYQLYREPAVQDFLRKPLDNMPTPKVLGTLQELEQLDPNNAFFALTSISDSAPSLVGGFRFRGTQEDAERVIGKWRAMLWNNVQARRARNFSIRAMKSMWSRRLHLRWQQRMIAHGSSRRQT